MTGSPQNSFLHHPVDPVSAQRLGEQSLDLALLDTTQAELYGHWLRADERGFHVPLSSPEQVEALRAAHSYRRHSGVWDHGTTGEPVATIASWPTALTVPGERQTTAWAISSVTVSPTHRRRGIARALVEAELRTARELALPLAILTVSEATLYGRYGFAPAVSATRWTITTSRVQWSGPETTGSIRFVDPATAAEVLADLHETHRVVRSGQVEVWQLRWDSMAGVGPFGAEQAKHLRAATHVDSSGAVTGIVVYRVAEDDPTDFTKHTLTVVHLLATTAEAYAGLWRFVLETDLVHTVTAPLRAVDEPLWWMLGDRRAAVVTEYDHLWTRILDVPAALGARDLGAAAPLTLEVTDPLGMAAGVYEVRDGDVRAVESASADTHRLRLDVGALSALYLGGASAVALHLAGRIHGSRDAVEQLHGLLTSSTPPWLSVWF